MGAGIGGVPIAPTTSVCLDSSSRKYAEQHHVRHLYVVGEARLWPRQRIVHPRLHRYLETANRLAHEHEARMLHEAHAGRKCLPIGIDAISATSCNPRRAQRAETLATTATGAGASAVLLWCSSGCQPSTASMKKKPTT